MKFWIALIGALSLVCLTGCPPPAANSSKEIEKLAAETERLGSQTEKLRAEVEQLKQHFRRQVVDAVEQVGGKLLRDENKRVIGVDFSGARRAVTGADLPPKVDGEGRETWTAFEVKAGQVLSFDFLKGGARAYIAVSGGIDTPLALGSRSTYALGALGGLEGRSLQAGDSLPVGTAAASVTEGRQVPESLRRMPGATAELRVLTGLYWHRLTEASGRGFFDYP